MKFVSFIGSRMAEPITALDIREDNIAFGSISGYFGLFNAKTKKVKYSDYCEDELVRYIKICGESVYVIIGDEKTLKVALPGLEHEETIAYDTFKHSGSFCPNTFNFIGKKNDKLTSLLLYFPTPDSEKARKLTRVGNC